VGSIAGSKLANTCAVGHIPGQPSGLSAPEPAPVGLTSPTAFATGNVPAANTHLPKAFEPSANRCMLATRLPTSGALPSDVPAPASNASMFIGCFEYSYDSMPVE